MKVCRSCQLPKPESRYVQYRSICMDCRNATARAARPAREERKKQAQRELNPKEFSNPWLAAHYPGRNFHDAPDRKR